MIIWPISVAKCEYCRLALVESFHERYWKGQHLSRTKHHSILCTQKNNLSKLPRLPGRL